MSGNQNLIMLVSAVVGTVLGGILFWPKGARVVAAGAPTSMVA